jgi:L-Ala-D/L-Glu epimerase
MRLEIERVTWPYAAPFRIASGLWNAAAAETVQVRLAEGSYAGRGEGLPVFYRGESVERMVWQLEGVRSQIEGGVSRKAALDLLPPGGARNALDCALWDLEAKRRGQRAWELAGVGSVISLRTAYTLGVDEPEAMAKQAGHAVQFPLLKLKLAGEGDLERVRAVRRARPDADLIVDANQAWNERLLRTLPLQFAQLGVRLIEQPVPVDEDELLLSLQSPVPLCADESCQTTESLPTIRGKYRYVNIKLDKTGGLTEALRLASTARALNFHLMVGCMAGSSLAMAPAFIIGQLCDVIDLDGPLLASRDVPHAIHYDGSLMSPPSAELWG